MVCGLLLTTGCAETQIRTGYGGSKPLPPKTAAYYDYPRVKIDPSVKLLRERAAFNEYFVEFPLAASGFEPTEPVVEVEWFASKRPGRRPALIFNPILGGDYPLERGICRFLAANGFHTAMVRRKTLKISPEHDVARIELLLRQGVLRIRQVTDWVQTRPEVDPDRLGCYGISMGGIACVMASAVEPRFKATVAALAGGPISEILATSTDSLLTKPRTRYLQHNNLDLATLKRLMDERITSDPVLLAPYVDATRLFMFIAVFDRTIGRSHSLVLWRALGRPRVVFLPAGHYTSYLLLPYLKFASLRYFQATLGTQPK